MKLTSNRFAANSLRLWHIFGGIVLLLSCATTLLAQQDSDFIDDTKIQDELYFKGVDFLAKEHVGAEKIFEQLKNAPHSYSLERKRDKDDSETVQISRNFQSSVIIGCMFSNDGNEQKFLGTAGGVVVSPDGLVLTNYHVMLLHKNAHNFFTMTHDGQVFQVTEVLAADEAKDLALIRVDAKNLVPAVIAHQAPVPNSEIYLIHHPHARFYSTDTGSVSRYTTKVTDNDIRRHWMEITAVFSYGSSGCGAFNENGKLIGLVSRKEIVRKRYPNNVSEVELVIRQCVPRASIIEFLSASGPKNANLNKDEALHSVADTTD